MENKLQRGDWAPPFKTVDIRGEEFDFSSVANWGIWLAFYRYATCPMCNQHFDDVVGQQIRLLENRILFVAVFESELKNFPKSIIAREFPNVKIIADPEHRLYEPYGVERSWAKLFTPQAAIERLRAGAAGYREGKIDGPLDRVPAHFLILPQGMIHQARYGRTAADHLKWRDLGDFYDCVRGQLSQTNRVPQPIVDPNVEDRTLVIERKIEETKTLELNPEPKIPQAAAPREAPPPPPSSQKEQESVANRAPVLDVANEKTLALELDSDSPKRRDET